MGILDVIGGAAEAIAGTVKSGVEYILSKRKQEQDLLKEIQAIRDKEKAVRSRIKARIMEGKSVFNLYAELTDLGTERSKLQERLDTMKRCNENSEDGK